MKPATRRFTIAAALLILFFVLTVIVMKVDVQPIGPQDSEVGCAALNGAVHDAFGTSEGMYQLTERIGYLALATVAVFGVIGLVQLIRRKSLCKVDPDILVLGGFYIIVLILYVLFSKIVINYRPVLEDGVLEASYPSSHTMLAICTMGAVMIEGAYRIRNSAISFVVRALSGGIMAVLILGRLLSGMHWLTDIIGGMLLGAALLTAFDACFLLVTEKGRKQ